MQCIHRQDNKKVHQIVSLQSYMIAKKGKNDREDEEKNK